MKHYSWRVRVRVINHQTILLRTPKITRHTWALPEILMKEHAWVYMKRTISARWYYFTWQGGRALNFTASKRIKKLTGCVIYMFTKTHTVYRRWQFIKFTKQQDLCWPREDWCPEWQRMAERQKQRTSDDVGRRVRGSQLAPDSHLW